MHPVRLILVLTLVASFGCQTPPPWRPGTFGVFSLLKEKYQGASHDPPPTHANVAYGAHERQQLDFYAAPGDGPRPVYVYFHGGGFAVGSKRELRPSVIRAFHARGISVASRNYRLVKHGPLPQPLHDAARAVQFIRNQAAAWNLDPQRLPAGGHSAGGLMALWLGLHGDLDDPASDDPVARQSTRLVCVATSDVLTNLDWAVVYEWFGVEQLRPYPSTKECLGIERLEQLTAPETVRLMRAVSPYYFVTADDPPAYLRLQAALRGQGVEAVVHYRHGPHPVYRDGVEFVAEKFAARR